MMTHLETEEYGVLGWPFTNSLTVVSTPAMSGEGNMNVMVNSVISGVSFIVTIAF